jgi:hypothetical protein
MSSIDNALRTLKGIPSGAHPKGAYPEGTRRRAGKPAAAVLTVLTLASLGLSACGGSSGSTASQTGTTATTATRSAGASTSAGGSPSPGNGIRPAGPRLPAIRECLQKNGVTLGKRTPGAGGPSGGAISRAGGGVGGPQLPKGVTPAQFQAALKKCAGGSLAGRSGRPGSGFARSASPAFGQALAKFAACLRQNGVNIPAPNTSGKGPIFSTKGINTSSPQFRSASMKCRSALIGAFRRP